MINLEYNKIRPALILSLGLAPLSMLAQVHVSGRVLDENKKAPTVCECSTYL